MRGGRDGPPMVAEAPGSRQSDDGRCAPVLIGPRLSSVDKTMPAGEPSLRRSADGRGITGERTSPVGRGQKPVTANQGWAPVAVTPTKKTAGARQSAGRVTVVGHVGVAGR